MATDFAIILGSFSLALYFRRYNLGRESQGFQFLPEMVLMMIYAGAMIVVFSALGMYQRKTWLSRLWHLGGIVKGTVFTLGGYFLLRGMAKELYLVPSRYVLLLWAVFLFLGLAVHRLLLFPMLIRMASRQGLQRRVVLIGDSPLGHDFVRKWQKLGDRATVNVIGVLTNKGDLRIIREVPILGRIEELAVLVQEYNIEGAVITNPDLSYDELMLLIEECIRLFGWVDVHSDKSVVWHSGSQADFYFDIPFIRMSGVPRNPFYMIYKRTFDVIAASLALLILSPLLLVVIALVRITSPGPVFYIRPRIGQNGRAFPFY
ncbi:MAG: sugar transferase, partial [Kiritimatiellia bacterium]|nr:sugar transferase [Kiritimatiellia bacterium]